MYTYIDKRLETHLRLNHLTSLHSVGRVQDPLSNSVQLISNSEIGDRLERLVLKSTQKISLSQCKVVTNQEKI